MATAAAGDIFACCNANDATYPYPALATRSGHSRPRQGHVLTILLRYRSAVLIASPLPRGFLRLATGWERPKQRQNSAHRPIRSK